ncbi:MAG: hypothetical protein J6Q80_04150, partial [Lentisphaeria bacterium]|nr:hypothetical protein [Lentisphaeria bacterium]
MTSATSAAESTFQAELCCSSPAHTEEGFDPVYGARPLRRAIVRLVED